MYQLHPDYRVIATSARSCRISDGSEHLELTAARGKVPQLIRCLSRSFRPEELSCLLDDEGAWPPDANPWWERLQQWVVPAQADAGSAELMVHINSVTEPGQSILRCLAQEGLNYFLSHDEQPINSHNAHGELSDAHIGQQATAVMAAALRKVQRQASLAPASAFANQYIDERHFSVMILRSTEDVSNLGAHISAGLASLPVYCGSNSLVVGPWFGPQGQAGFLPEDPLGPCCLPCWVDNARQLAGDFYSGHHYAGRLLAKTSLVVAELVADYRAWLSQCGPHPVAQQAVSPVLAHRNTSFVVASEQWGYHQQNVAAAVNCPHTGCWDFAPLGLPPHLPEVQPGHLLRPVAIGGE